MRGVSRVYVASKSRYGPLWVEQRDEGRPIVSTWIDECGEGEIGDWADLWMRCIKEASNCDVLVAYYEEGDGIWKGAHVEIGAALSHDKPVFLVGPVPEEWSWTRHPLVTRCASMDDAWEAALR